ncbi:MAG: tRNA pseudouridine(54/55) synthase Pus10 [Nitrosopumilus sp.]|nr:tRNA pseudouridine(54/55) synthase Pus10 [Nitrosopumilus sp.]
MSNYSEITSIANSILKKYDLCDQCLGRLFSKQLHLSSNKFLGKKLKKNYASKGKCYVCKDLFSNLDYFLKLMLDLSSNYEFQTYGVGIIIKPSIVDRDDFIRSKYKLKGIDSIKTDIAKELIKLFTKKTQKTLDSFNPEITFTVNLKDESCQLHSKSITIFGKYIKSERGYAQKQTSCDNCSGTGCRVCDFHGISEFESIEGIISKLIFKKFGGTTTKFTWIGGEDKSSLVLGNGRPFFVKIKNPSKRKSKLSDEKFDSVSVFNLKLVDTFPKKPLNFYSRIKIKISAKLQINSKKLKKLKDLTTCPIVIYEKSGKRYEKKIFDLKYKKNSTNLFTIIMSAEGGFPIKRFVIGDDVSPSISSLLDNSCVAQEFDFLNIVLK